jgi:hypothetical protein
LLERSFSPLYTIYPLYPIPDHIYTRNKRFVLWAPEDCPWREV